MTQVRKEFSVFPSTAQAQAERIEVTYPQAELDSLYHLLAASRVGPETYESRQQDRKYGITTQWLDNAKAAWLEEFNW